MKFEKHLFVSYAHLDDVVSDGDPKGWVGHFYSALGSFLSMTLARQPVIWRDDRLDGNDDFSAEIVAQFPKTAVMISIVSERYLESEWCIREVTEFCKAAERTGGLMVENKMRVHQVLLRPLAHELRQKLPGNLSGALGYCFYKPQENGRFMPLDPRFGEKFRDEFNQQIFILADDIATVIKKLLAGTEAPQPAGPKKPCIYLAECSWDRAGDREKIRSELRATGYTVLPEQGARLPDEEAEYIAEVKRLLDLCQLSLHVVGANAAKVPDGPGRKDAVQLQNEIAAQKSAEHGLPRVIWLPAIKSAQMEHQAFINALRSQAWFLRGADLIEDTLESFKNAVRVTLQKIEEPPPKKVEAASGGAPLVYVLCVANDRPATVPLRKFLRDAGLEVQLPVFEGDAATVRQANDDLLARCNAAIIFYGAGDEAWKRTIDIDLQKSKSARGQKPLLASLTYLATPATAHKADCIEMGEPNMMNGLEIFPQAELTALVQALKGAAK